MRRNITVLLFLITAQPCAWAHTDVTATQARDLIDTVEDLVVVDVREPYEYCDAVGRISGALNYPLSSGVLQARYEELPMDVPILVVCRSGGRSNVAANSLDSQGLSEVYDMAGGMNAWLWDTVPCKYAGGSGTPGDPYQIATAADLIALGETPDDYDKHFILTADLDLDPNLPGGMVFDRAVIAPETCHDPWNWEYEGIPFQGVLDGKGFVISNLHIQGMHCIGLFGRLGAEASISNLGLEIVDIDGIGIRVGALAGVNDGVISNCYSTGHVNSTFIDWLDYLGFVGGLVGQNAETGILKRCRSSTLVSQPEFGVSAGGLVGSNAGTVSASYSAGIVRGGRTIGGLVGANSGAITRCHSTSIVSGGHASGCLVGTNFRTGKIESSYSAGGVDGSSDVGGLVGQNGGIVSNSYSDTAIIGNEFVGGLIGRNYYGIGDHHPGTVLACYSTGTVSGEGEVGGLVGLDFYNGVHSSLWDMETSGQSTSAGGTGLTTAEMQTTRTFLEAGWDFVGETENGPNDVWEIVEGQTYPLLSWQKYGGGTGEPNAPYLIYTAEHLNALGAEPNDYDKHFKLMADIDLSGYTYGRAVIAPDAGLSQEYSGTPFSGVFNGMNHRIRNLTIEGVRYLGLFGSVGGAGTVLDLGLEQVDITAATGWIKTSEHTKCYQESERVGGLAGYSRGQLVGCHSVGVVVGERQVGGVVGANDGHIYECSSSGSVLGNVGGVGGVIGSNRGSIDKAFSTSRVDGGGHVGGFVGYNTEDGLITNCYCTGRVTGGDDVGGFAGWSAWCQFDCIYDMGITTSFSTGAVSGFGGAVGGFIGTSHGRVVSCFWDVETSGWDTSAGGVGKTTAEMQAADTFVGWGCGNERIWTIDEGRDYPRLAWENRSGDTIMSPYVLCDLLLGTGAEDDPYCISTAEELYFVSMAPCDWDKHFKLTTDIDLSAYSFDRAPIAPYTYDAQPGFWKIAFTGVFDGSGHDISSLTVIGDGYLGLFGKLEAGGVVRNLRVVDANIAGSGDYVGALAGCNGEAINGGWPVGWLTEDGGVLANCDSTGTVSGQNMVGGLVGVNVGRVITSSSSCEVSGEEHIGGLAGINLASINKSYSAGATTGTYGVGGLVGSAGGYSFSSSEIPDSIIACYSTGTVRGEAGVGGLVGVNSSSITSSFWDTETSRQAASGGGTGLTTAEMQTASTFLDVGWDFIGETENGTDDIWWILEGQDYPRLWWELVEEVTETAEN